MGDGAPGPLPAHPGSVSRGWDTTMPTSTSLSPLSSSTTTFSKVLQQDSTSRHWQRIQQWHKGCKTSSPVEQQVSVDSSESQSRKKIPRDGVLHDKTPEHRTCLNEGQPRIQCGKPIKNGKQVLLLGCGPKTGKHTCHLLRVDEHYYQMC